MNADDPTKPDLSLVDTDWMIDELARRSDTLLVVREYDRDDKETQTIIDSTGALSSRIGLACRALQRLLHSAQSSDEC